MVHVKVRFVFGHEVVAVVQLAGVSWEPRVLGGYVVIPEQGHVLQGAGLAQTLDQLKEVDAGHVDLDQGVELVVFPLVGTGLKMYDDALVFLDGFQDAREGVHAFAEAEDQGGTLHGFFGFGSVGNGIGQDHFFFGEASV